MRNRLARWKDISGSRVTGRGMMIIMMTMRTGIIGCPVIGLRRRRSGIYGRPAIGVGPEELISGIRDIGVRISGIMAASTTVAGMWVQGIAAASGVAGGLYTTRPLRM